MENALIQPDFLGQNPAGFPQLHQELGVEKGTKSALKKGNFLELEC